MTPIAIGRSSKTNRPLRYLQPERSATLPFLHQRPQCNFQVRIRMPATVCYRHLQSHIPHISQNLVGPVGTTKMEFTEFPERQQQLRVSAELRLNFGSVQEAEIY
jgi:hypothetical protein